MNTSKINSVLLCTVALLTACTNSESNPNPIMTNQPSTNNGGDSSSPSEIDDNNSGRIIDGYIENAYICIDANTNYVCESSEKIQHSNSQGRYANSEFLNSTISRNSPLIAQIIAGLSKDQDDNGVTISTSYVMVAMDDNPSLITPFTTLLNFWQHSGLDKTEAELALMEALGLTQAEITQDYISANSNKARKMAKVIVLTLQKIIVKEIESQNTDSSNQADLQASVWEQFTRENLSALNTIIEDASNTDLQPNQIVQTWLIAQPNLYLDTNNPTNPSDPRDLSEFKKINGKGELLDNSATDYQCVTQIKDSLGNSITNSEQKTWMLLIPASATFNSLGFIPSGFSGADKFWNYTWELYKDPALQSTFKETNGLIRQYSSDDNVEHFLTLLNSNNYCGFSDWNVPTIASLKTLNTTELTSDTSSSININIKSISGTIFKHYAAHRNQVNSRINSNQDLLQPYFWTNNRTLNYDATVRVGMNDFTKFQHPNSSLSLAENTAGGKLIDDQLQPAPDVVMGGQYHALRAVRYDRYQRVDNSGSTLDLTSTDWSCIRDSGPIDNRYSSPVYWSVLEAADLDILKTATAAKVGEAISSSRCGLNNWRLPSSAELIGLKAMNSDQYFVAKNPNGNHKKLSSFTEEQDYFWLNVSNTDEDKISLWGHSDMLISSSGTPNIGANTLFISSTTSTDPALLTPAAPTAGTVNDVYNTFSWSPNPQYLDVGDYEYSNNNGIAWLPVTTNPIGIGNNAIPIGHLQLRVKATPSANNPGRILSNAQAFTIKVATGNCSMGDAAVEINSLCYSRYDAEINWTQARDFCISQNASLVDKATALSIDTVLANGLSLRSSPTHYWLLESELNYGRARAFTDYPGYWKDYNQDIRYLHPIICVK